MPSEHTFGQVIIGLNHGIIPLVAYNKSAGDTGKIVTQALTSENIDQEIKNGKTVIVAIESDWCLRCKYNQITVFNLPSVKNKIENSNIVLIRVDFNRYDEKVLSFMQKYRRNNVPLYVLLSPLAPEGIVLPTVLENRDFINLINNFTLRGQGS